jgi:integrase
MTVEITLDGRWYVRVQVNKKRISKYFGRGALNEARARTYQDSLDERKGKIDPAASILTLTLCESYRRDHLVEESTGKMDKYKFRILVANLGAIPAEVLTSKHLSAYLKARLKQGVKRTTIKNEIARLKAAFSWAEDQDPPLILHNHIRKFRIEKIGPRDVPLPPTTSELKAILPHCPPHLVRAIILERYCGMRPGPQELFRVSWEDVDWEVPELRVRSAHKGGPEYRMVPIAPPLLAQLKAWFKFDTGAIDKKSGLKLLEKNPALPIVNYRGRGIKSVKSAWNAAKTAAGITRRIRPYDLRHAFVTFALRAGADLGSTSQIIGHSRPDTTIREYQHVTKDDHRRVVDLTPDFSGAIPVPLPKSPPHQPAKNTDKSHS